MGDPFDLSFLDHLPQRRRLALVLADLWAEPSVRALWLGGSLARGAGDAYSDVDLRVAVTPEAFSDTEFPAGAGRLREAAVAVLPLRFGVNSVLFHMLLDDGEIYDLNVLRSDQRPPNERRRLLACRDDNLAAQLDGGADPDSYALPATQEGVEQALTMFWITMHKGQKVLHRGMPLMALQGHTLLRQELIRLWYMQATGNDCGPVSRLTIHTLTPVIQAVQGAQGSAALTALGRPLRTKAEIYADVDALCDAVATVGRTLAQQLGFAYPEALEKTVRQSWRTFRAEHPESPHSP
jgi:predicted nucleotidyltransferase